MRDKNRTWLNGRTLTATLTLSPSAMATPLTQNSVRRYLKPRERCQAPANKDLESLLLDSSLSASMESGPTGFGTALEVGNTNVDQWHSHSR